MYLGKEGNDSDDAIEQGQCPSFIQCINIVRCTLAQPNETDGWRRTTIFRIYMKIGDKNCKIIVDSRSCIIVVSYRLVSMIVWKRFRTLILTK